MVLPAAEAPAADAQSIFFRSLVDRLNQRPPQTKSIPCDNFRQGADFDQWSTIFVDTVKAINGLGANDTVRINQLCVIWLPTKLQEGSTRAVYDDLTPTVKEDWAQLRPALSAAFRDESEEIEFLNNENSWKRTPGMTLREYKNGLVLRLEKYQPTLKTVNAEYERAAIRRFRAGLDNPVLSAHILMTCVGDKHTLQDAFSVAVNYENTLKTISQSDSVKNLPPTLASMITFPHTAAYQQNDHPQFSVLSTQQEKNERRFEGIETSLKQNQLDMGEVKAGLVEVKESLKGFKEEMARSKQYASRPAFQRPVRPVFPVSRMPLQNPSSYFPQYGRFSGPRPNITPGITSGPGYVTNQYVPTAQGQGRQTARPVQGPNLSSDMNKLQLNDKTGPQSATAETVGAMEGKEPEGGNPENVYFPNPNLLYGSTDLGYGWTGTDVTDAEQYGYDLNPTGLYAFSDTPF